MRLIGGTVSPRVWVETEKEPSRICLGLARLRFAFDIDEAVALAAALVAAVDEIHDRQQPKERQ